MSIASVWLEVFSRNIIDDPTDFEGSEEGVEFCLVSSQELRQPESGTPLSTWVHDDADFFSTSSVGGDSNGVGASNQ